MMMQLGDQFGILQLSAHIVARQSDSSHIGPVKGEYFGFPSKLLGFQLLQLRNINGRWSGLKKTIAQCIGIHIRYVLKR
jgi:hypothetical protein